MLEELKIINTSLDKCCTKLQDNPNPKTIREIKHYIGQLFIIMLDLDYNQEDIDKEIDYGYNKVKEILEI